MKILLSVLIIGCLSGCFSRQMEVITEPIERPRLNLPDYGSVEMNPVEFLVVTPENAEEVFERLEKSRIVPVFFGLTGVYYKNLAVNMELLKQYIVYQNEVIKIYKSYYESDSK